MLFVLADPMTPRCLAHFCEFCECFSADSSFSNVLDRPGQHEHNFAVTTVVVSPWCLYSRFEGAAFPSIARVCEGSAAYGRQLLWHVLRAQYLKEQAAATISGPRVRVVSDDKGWDRAQAEVTHLCVCGEWCKCY